MRVITNSIKKYRMKKAASRIIAHLSSGMLTYYDINNQNETKLLPNGSNIWQDSIIQRGRTLSALPNDNCYS